MRESEIRKSYVVGIVVVRYVLLPLFGVAIVRGAYHLGLVHSDPLYRFVLMIQFAVPPAFNIGIHTGSEFKLICFPVLFEIFLCELMLQEMAGTITQLFGAGESECSVIMLWTYALASLSLTLWSAFFLWLVS